MQHVWVFQLANAPLQASKQGLMAELESFVAVWKAHGSPVPGSVELRHERFVIVQAEPGHASGCSIDSMTKGVTEILGNHGLQVVGPEWIHYLDANGAISTIDFREAKAAVADGRLNADTIVFDSTMGNKNDLAHWEVPLSKTWLNRLLPQAALKS